MIGPALRKMLMKSGEKGSAMLGKLGAGAKSAASGVGGMAKEGLPLYAALALSNMTPNPMEDDETEEMSEDELTDSEYAMLLKKLKEKGLT